MLSSEKMITNRTVGMKAKMLTALATFKLFRSFLGPFEVIGDFPFGHSPSSLGIVSWLDTQDKALARWYSRFAICDKDYKLF